MDFLNLNESVKTAIRIAQAIAREYANPYYTPAHLLKAMLHKDVGLQGFISYLGKDMVTTQHLLNDGKFNKMRSLKLNWYIWNAMPILTYRLTINTLQFLLCERFNF